MYIIGIAGGSGSGKTTFATKVLQNIGTKNVEILHMDSYYLHDQPQDLSTPKGPNFDHPEAFDWDLLREHIKTLRSGGDISKPVYDFETCTRTESTISVGPCEMIIFEGIFSLYDKNIRSMLDISCFLHVESDIRFTRRLHRDVKERGRTLESVISQYYDTVRPMYQKFLAPQKDHADFIVGEETDNAAHILAARLKELLN